MHHLNLPNKHCNGRRIRDNRSPHICVKIVFAAVILLFSATYPTMAQAQKTFKIEPAATDTNVQYIGRVQRDEQKGTVRYDWVGTYLRTGFTGTQIAAYLSDEGESYHNVFIDDRWVKKIKVTGKTPQRVVLASGLKNGSHRLVLQKCTEGEYGCTTVHSFDLQKGQNLFALPVPNRLIEVIGDSYTCGYGTESNKATDPFRLETENCDKAYACLLAHYFGADYVLAAHSGRGIVRNWADTVQVSKGNMSQRYLQLFDHHGTQPYDFKAYRPNLVMINLGTNDFSPVVTPSVEQYVGAYIRLIDAVHKHYGPIPIICIRPHSAGVYLSASFKVLQQRLQGHKDVHFAEFMPGIITVNKDLGASYHPNYSGQQKLCMTLIPLVSAVMGWEIKEEIRR